MHGKGRMTHKRISWVEPGRLEQNPLSGACSAIFEGKAMGLLKALNVKLSGDALAEGGKALVGKWLWRER
jgi:hypothetical protein